MNSIHKNRKKGFTLLEIILVIAAIGILAAIVLVAINPNRQLAQVRNAERRSEINTIYKALEQYLIDKGSYPAGITTSIQDICNTGSNGVGQGIAGSNCVDLRVLVPDYIASIPIDPQGVVYKVGINGANNRVSVSASNKELGQVIGVNNAWTLSKLSELALWLDAADASTITLNGSTVSQWNDKSGNGRNVTQSTASNQPTYNSAQFNGKPTLRFDGSNDILLNPSVGAAGLTSVTIISVLRMLSIANEDVLMGIGPTGTPGTIRGLYRQASSTTVGFAGWGNDVLSSSISYDVGGSPHIFATWNTQLNTPDNVRINRDGATPTVHTTNGGNLNTTLNGFSVGSLQGSLVGNYHTNMDVGEVVVLYSAVNDTDRQKLEGYLAHKWGLVHNLPVNHPYRWDGREFGYTFSGITDTDAQTYIAAVETADGQSLENATRTAIQNFIVGAKADGIWDAIKSSNILAGARTLNGALVPLKGTAPTNFNFVSGDYDRKTGLVKNGSTKYLDSNRNNNADPQNNNHIALYSPVEWAVSNGYYYAGRGGDSSGGRGFRSIVSADPVYSVRSRAMNISLASFNITRSPGFMGTSRQNSSQVQTYADKQLVTAAVNSATPLDGPISIFANNNDSTNGVFNLRLSFYSIGESLDLALLDTRVTQLMTDLGNAIP